MKDLIQIFQSSFLERLLKPSCLVLLMLVPLGASAQRFGDWVVSNERDATVAINRNSSGSALGYLCSRAINSCHFFYSANENPCREGETFVLLTNAGQVSDSWRTTCRRMGRGFRQELVDVLDDAATVTEQMLSAGNAIMGIARGVGADGFAVSKFRMTGFRQAYDRVNQVHSSVPSRGRVGDSVL